MRYRPILAVVLALALGSGVARADEPVLSAVPAQESPARAQLSWVLASLAKPPPEAEVLAHFDEGFRAAVPDLGGLFGTLAVQLGDVALASVESDHEGALVAKVHSQKAGPLRIRLSVEPGGTHRMVGLLFQPAPDAAPPAQSWAEVDARIGALAPKVGLLAAELSDGACQPVHALNPDQPLAIGSAFKLYVLDELARQVWAGERRWTDTLAIDESLKSLPTGDMRSAPAGTGFSLEHYARKMISESDNTATDHLLGLLGRAKVEATAARSGNDRNRPFLSTREMFGIKLVMDEKARKRFIGGDEAKRRRMADEARALDLAPAMNAVATWTAPRHIETIEWFASPEELCHEASALRAYTDPAVRRVLSVNPGIPDETGQWAWIGFKGGSEPGVLNLSWILERSDGRAWFLSVGFNDPAAPLDEAAAISAAAAARSFLATIP
jgi:hypothetical protein